MKRAVCFSLVLLLSSCDARPPSRREAGALTGTALGAGLGAIVGNQVGNSGAGIAIGSAFGALSGAVLGNTMDAEDRRLDEQDSQLQEQERELQENRRIIQELRSRGADARSTDRGIVVNLPDVLFEFDSARLTNRARDIAEEIAKVARDARRNLSVEGHTDSVGKTQYNQRLSNDRAEAVAEELQDLGIPRRAISVQGFGESRPVASNATAEGRGRNRRVEVVIENR